MGIVERERGRNLATQVACQTVGMDWASFWTIIATGAVTIGGVVVKGWFDGRADRRRIAAEDMRAIEADRRATEQAAAAAAASVRQGDAQAGRAALAEFAKMLKHIQGYPSGVGADAIQSDWQTYMDANARMTVETIGDSDIRAAMSAALDALTNFGPYSGANQLARTGTWNAEWLVKLLISLAGCVSRGTLPDERLRGQMSLLEQRLVEMRDQYEF